jgi:hypothetical protein
VGNKQAGAFHRQLKPGIRPGAFQTGGQMCGRRKYDGCADYALPRNDRVNESRNRFALDAIDRTAEEKAARCGAVGDADSAAPNRGGGVSEWSRLSEYLLWLAVIALVAYAAVVVRNEQ